MLTPAMAMMIGLEGNEPATYIGGGQRALSGDPSGLTLPGGAQAGDLICVLTTSNGAMSGGAGGAWTWSVAFGGAYLGVKRLQAADLPSNALACSSYPMVYGVYRGPKSSTRRTSGSANGSGPTVTGFVKDRWCAGLLGLGDGNTSTTAAPTLTAPWTLRQLVDGSTGTHRLALYDLLTPASYVDNASIAFGGSSNGTTYGAVDELLN